MIASLHVRYRVLQEVRMSGIFAVLALDQKNEHLVASASGNPEIARDTTSYRDDINPDVVSSNDEESSRVESKRSRVDVALRPYHRLVSLASLSISRMRVETILLSWPTQITVDVVAVEPRVQRPTGSSLKVEATRLSTSGAGATWCAGQVVKMLPILFSDERPVVELLPTPRIPQCIS